MGADRGVGHGGWRHRRGGAGGWRALRGTALAQAPPRLTSSRWMRMALSWTRRTHASSRCGFDETRVASSSLGSTTTYSDDEPGSFRLGLIQMSTERFERRIPWRTGASGSVVGRRQPAYAPLEMAHTWEEDRREGR